MVPDATTFASLGPAQVVYKVSTVCAWCRKSEQSVETTDRRLVPHFIKLDVLPSFPRTDDRNVCSPFTDLLALIDANLLEVILAAF
jgi:hypothetical protein